jgi:hypothetical protein
MLQKELTNYPTDHEQPDFFFKYTHSSFPFREWRLGDHNYLDTSSTSETTSLVVTESRATSSLELVFLAVTSLGAHGGLFVCGRNNLRGKGQVRSEVFDSLIGQVAVVVLPGEGDANISLRLKRLHQAKDLQVGGSLDLRVGGRLGVLLDNADTLLKEVAEDSDAVFLGDKHGG